MLSREVRPATAEEAATKCASPLRADGYFCGGVGRGAGDAPPRPSPMPIEVDGGLISLGGRGFGLTALSLPPDPQATRVSGPP
jgi:hypothetical protein